MDLNHKDPELYQASTSRANTPSEIPAISMDLFMR